MGKVAGIEALQRYTAAMIRATTLWCLVFLGLSPLVATAQWQWIDQSGRRVFSDSAPPPEIPAKNILRQPSGSRSVAVPAQAAAAPAPAVAAQAAASAPRISGQDSALQQRVRANAQAEEAKQKEAQQEAARLKAENCQNARRGIATYNSGQRVAIVNDKGEREVLDDAGRERELAKLRSIEQSECGG
jgi:hypothetical protein